MVRHSVVILLLLSIGTTHLNGEPCARLYMQGLNATNYPQVEGVFILKEPSSVKVKDYSVYQHELDDIYLYYNSTAEALTVSVNWSLTLLRAMKKLGVEMSSHESVSYTLDSVFEFQSWTQWDPLQQKIVEVENSNIKPVCVDESFGFCTSGVLVASFSSPSPTISKSENLHLHAVLDEGKMRFNLLPRVYRNMRPVYRMENKPYYLYYQDRKWKIATAFGDNSSEDAGVMMEMESDVMRVEYEQRAQWYVVAGDRIQAAQFGPLQCSRQLHGSAEGCPCENFSVCVTDSAGVSSCRCQPQFRGIYCQKPVEHCPEPVASTSHVFVSGKSEGNVASTFCPSGRVIFSVCNGVMWLPNNSFECLTTSSIVFPLSPEKACNWPAFRRRDHPAKIGAVIVVLVGLQLALPFLCYCFATCCKCSDDKGTDEDGRSPAQKRVTKFLRACSGFFYFSWWAWFVYLGYYLSVWHKCIKLDGTNVFSAAAVMAIICLCLLYIVVLCESICSREYEYLTKVKDHVIASELIAKMKSELPTIKFKADCWHSETRTRTIHDGSGEDGNGMHTEMCTVRVSTANVDESFAYSGCVDVSDNFLLPLASAAVTDVSIEVHVEFADDESKSIYDEAFERFKNVNKHRDRDVDFSIVYELPSFVRNLAIRDPGKRWMTSCCFSLATIFCLTWPYRWLLLSSKNISHYRIVKRVLVQPGGYQSSLVMSDLSAPIIVTADEQQPFLAVLPSVELPATPPPPYDEPEHIVQQPNNGTTGEAIPLCRM